MDKMVKILLITVIAGLVAVLGYFFAWKKANVFSPTPKMPASIAFQETGGGCGNVFVYKINRDNTIGISVSAIREKLNLSTAEKTFDIGKTTSGLNAAILAGSAENKIAEFYCNDVSTSDQPKPRRLIGKSGKATVSISGFDESQPEWNRRYTATVILKDVHFVEEDGSNSDVTVDYLIFKDVRVGWLPG